MTPTSCPGMFAFPSSKKTPLTNLREPDSYILTVHSVSASTHYSTYDVRIETNHWRLAAHELCDVSGSVRAGNSRSGREHYVIWQATVLSFFPSLVVQNTTRLMKRKPRPSSYLGPLITRPQCPLWALLLCNLCPSSKSAVDAVNTIGTELPDDNKARREAALQFVVLLGLPLLQVRVRVKLKAVR